MQIDTDTINYPPVNIGNRPAVTKILPVYQSACTYGNDPAIATYRDLSEAGRTLGELSDTIKNMSDCIYFIYDNPTIKIDDCLRKFFPGVPVQVNASGRAKIFYKNGYLTVTEELK